MQQAYLLSLVMGFKVGLYIVQEYDNYAVYMPTTYCTMDFPMQCECDCKYYYRLEF